MQRYNKEFREEAISLSDEIGPKKAAQQLGINYATLIDWRKKRKLKVEKQKPPEEPGTVEELQKEIAELKKANDILKDALGFFATLKKEKLYQMDTTRMTVEEVKEEVWRYIFAYYNTVRISTETVDFLQQNTDCQKLHC